MNETCEQSVARKVENKCLNARHLNLQHSWLWHNIASLISKPSKKKLFYLLKFTHFSEKKKNRKWKWLRLSPSTTPAPSERSRGTIFNRNTWQARDDSSSSKRHIFHISSTWLDPCSSFNLASRWIETFVYVIAGIIIYLNIYAFHAALDQ